MVSQNRWDVSDREVRASALIAPNSHGAFLSNESTDEEEKANVSVGTAALLEYLHEKDGERQEQNQYTFCLGADAFLDLTAGKWKESERVLQLLRGRFVVLHRVDGSDATIDADPDELEERVHNVKGAKLVSVPSLKDVSSSRVREAVGRGDWRVLDEQMVNPHVLAYIRQKSLYTSIQE